MADGGEWPDGWRVAMAGEDMSIELRREVGPGHVLRDVPVTTVARCEYNDDVLFQLEDGTGRVADVHLTWTGHEERSPLWPDTAIYPDLAAWRAARAAE